MIWIELMGPSGVGKSYWCQKIFETYPELEPNTIVLKRIQNTKVYQKSPFKIKVFFALYKLRLPKIKSFAKDYLIQYFLRNFEKERKNIYSPIDETIISTYLKTSLESKEPYVIQLKKIEYFAQQLRKFKFYNYFLHERDIYIAEDGLQHLAPVYVPELEADYYLVLTSGLHQITQQRVERAEKKPSTYMEFKLNKEELKKYIDQQVNAYNIKIQTLKNRVVPHKVIEINSKKGDTIEMVKKIIKNL